MILFLDQELMPYRCSSCCSCGSCWGYTCTVQKGL